MLSTIVAGKTGLIRWEGGHNWEVNQKLNSHAEREEVLLTFAHSLYARLDIYNYVYVMLKMLIMSDILYFILYMLSYSLINL